MTTTLYTDSRTTRLLASLGIDDLNPGGFAGEWIGSGPELDVHTPIDGSRIATVRQVTEDEYDHIVARAHEAFLDWRTVPAPKRGEVVRQIGERLREHKAALGQHLPSGVDTVVSVDVMESAGAIPANRFPPIGFRPESAACGGCGSPA